MIGGCFDVVDMWFRFLWGVGVLGYVKLIVERWLCFWRCGFVEIVDVWVSRCVVWFCFRGEIVCGWKDCVVVGWCCLLIY